MTLLENLIEGASSGNAKVDSLLRQVKVFAARADSIVLDHWVEKELSGYGSGDELPQYRRAVEVEVIGHFSGPFNSGLQNAPIPKMAFPEFFRKNGLCQISIVEPISVVEEFSNSNTPLRAPWPADVVALANGLIQSGQEAARPGRRRAYEVAGSGRGQREGTTLGPAGSVALHDGGGRPGR
ncbi:hypothetical protein [Amycolatopsis rubida]|uniref:AbiTii domain-containing protein n=1 Tax=Amycolatopsis rubida TaxID=112413 RepID=UPI001160CF12|nr:hypothetical protein [Amycolatopsis rubida]